MIEYKLIEGNFISGDIVGVVAGGSSRIPAEIQYRCIAPPTILYHFFVIARKCKYENDYEIIESIGKGTAIGRLSWYEKEAYIVFRVNDPDVEFLGDKAIELASAYGRVDYDYFLFVKLFASAVECWWNQIWKEHRLRRIHYSELRASRNGNFICTELTNEIWRKVDRPPIPPELTYIPAGFVQAYLDKKISIIGLNYLSKLGRAAEWPISPKGN